MYLFIGRRVGDAKEKSWKGTFAPRGHVTLHPLPCAQNEPHTYTHLLIHTLGIASNVGSRITWPGITREFAQEQAKPHIHRRGTGLRLQGRAQVPPLCPSWMLCGLHALYAFSQNTTKPVLFLDWECPSSPVQ